MSAVPTWAETVQGALDLSGGANKKGHSFGDHVEYNNGRNTAQIDVMIYSSDDKSIRASCAQLHAHQRPPKPAFVAGYDEAAAQFGIPPWSCRFKIAAPEPSQ